MRSVLGELLDFRGVAESDVLVDMEAGLEHLSRGTTRHVDALFAIAEPYYRSMETARRVYELASELGIGRVRLVANKVRDVGESEAIRSFAEAHDLVLEGVVPHDETVVEADRVAKALLDVATGDAPAVRAIENLTQALLDDAVVAA